MGLDEKSEFSSSDFELIDAEIGLLSSEQKINNHWRSHFSVRISQFHSTRNEIVDIAFNFALNLKNKLKLPHMHKNVHAISSI